MQRDKAFIEIDGVPLWRRQLSLLEELQLHQIFIAGPNRSDWENEGCVIIPDAQQDVGPLAGLASGLRRSLSPFLLALAVDLPNMTIDYLCKLLACCPDQDGCVPRLSKRFEPLAAIYPITSLPFAESCLVSENHSLQNFVARCISEELVRPKEIAPNEEHLFLNLNTPEDLQAVTNG